MALHVYTPRVLSNWVPNQERPPRGHLHIVCAHPRQENALYPLLGPDQGGGRSPGGKAAQTYLASLDHFEKRCRANCEHRQGDNAHLDLPLTNSCFVFSAAAVSALVARMDVLQKKSSIVKETRTAPGDLASIQPSPRRRGGRVA